MPELQKFSGSDVGKIKAIPKTLKLSAIFYFAISLPVSLLIGFMGLGKRGFGYWNTVAIAFSFTSFIFILFITYKYILYRIDLSRQIKIVGTTLINGKSSKKGDTIISTNSKRLRKINLFSTEIFNKLEGGDELGIEISKYSKQVLSIKKNGVELI